MTKITPCNIEGFHYNGFLNVLDNANPAYNVKSPIKFSKKIYFCSNCGSWVNFVVLGMTGFGASEKINGFSGVRVETATSVFDLLAVTVGWIFFFIPAEDQVRCTLLGVIAFRLPGLGLRGISCRLCR